MITIRGHQHLVDARENAYSKAFAMLAKRGKTRQSFGNSQLGQVTAHVKNREPIAWGKAKTKKWLHRVGENQPRNHKGAKPKTANHALLL